MIDTDTLTVIMLFAAWAFFFLLGASIEAYYGIVSGIVGFLLVFELWALTANPTLTLVWSLVSVFSLILGVSGLMKNRAG